MLDWCQIKTWVQKYTNWLISLNKWTLEAKTWDDVFTFKNVGDLPGFLCIYVYQILNRFLTWNWPLEMTCSNYTVRKVSWLVSPCPTWQILGGSAEQNGRMSPNWGAAWRLYLLPNVFTVFKWLKITILLLLIIHNRRTGYCWWVLGGWWLQHTWRFVLLGVLLSPHQTLHAFCCLGQSCRNTMATLNGVHGGGSQPCLLHQASLYLGEGSAGTKRCCQLVKTELKEPLWTLQLTGDRGLTWCKPSKTWTHPQGESGKWKNSAQQSYFIFPFS